MVSGGTIQGFPDSTAMTPWNEIFRQPSNGWAKVRVIVVRSRLFVSLLKSHPRSPGDSIMVISSVLGTENIKRWTDLPKT